MYFKLLQIQIIDISSGLNMLIEHLHLAPANPRRNIADPVIETNTGMLIMWSRISRLGCKEFRIVYV